MRSWRLEDGGFLALIVLITLAFAWLVAPFFGAVMWGVIVGIVFKPVYRWLLVRFKGKRNTSAALCIVLILAVVILPAFLLGLSLVQEAATIYTRLQSGQLDLAQMFENVRASLPAWADDMIVSSGWTDLEAARRMIGSSLATLLQSIAQRALYFGQGALGLLASLGIMLYLAFFLLRDGEKIGQQVQRALPLREEVREELISHFLVVVRATMRGTVVVSLLQGLVGGIIFWMLGIDAPILWGLLMALFSLFPAVGTGIVWVPVAIYLMATGDVTEGLILTFCGFFVIGLIDNLLRPILVGHEAKMPEFVVLIATVAGLKLMGLNGVIIGPIIAALFIAVWQISADQRERSGESSP